MLIKYRNFIKKLKLYKIFIKNRFKIFLFNFENYERFFLEFKIIVDKAVKFIYFMNFLKDSQARSLKLSAFFENLLLVVEIIWFEASELFS